MQHLLAFGYLCTSSLTCPLQQGILLLARMAHLMEEQEGRGTIKRKVPPTGRGAVGLLNGAPAGDKGNTECDGVGDGEGDERHVIFKYLTPSDLRLTPEALVSTKVSHFRCNVNGCSRCVDVCGRRWASWGCTRSNVFALWRFCFRHAQCAVLYVHAQDFMGVQKQRLRR